MSDLQNKLSTISTIKDALETLQGVIDEAAESIAATSIDLGAAAGTFEGILSESGLSLYREFTVDTRPAVVETRAIADGLSTARLEGLSADIADLIEAIESLEARAALLGPWADDDMETYITAVLDAGHLTEAQLLDRLVHELRNDVIKDALESAGLDPDSLI